jgi:ankyrin repeat protein
MKNSPVSGRGARIQALVLITSVLMVTGLRAGEIHDAAAAGDLSKVRALLEADPALLESKDDRLSYGGNTPLISACWGPPTNVPQGAVASLLIEKGAAINARNTSGGSPVYFAHRSYELMERLIAKGADVNVRAYGGLTPLHQATLSGNVQVARLLIAHGADLDLRSNEGTILHRVINKATKAQSEMTEVLLQGGARLQTFSFGSTELHMAAMKGLADLVPLLVKHGADVNAVNEYGRTALYYAARHGQRQSAEALTGAGADARGVVETNYGHARQLVEPLKDGEAHLWYLGCDGSPCDGYAVKTKNHLLIFNPSRVDESTGAGLANGALNPSELVGQKMIVLITKRPGPRGPSVSELARALPGAELVLNYKPDGGSGGTGNLQSYRRAAPNESFSVGGVVVHTIPAMLRVFFEGEGLGYLVEADGVKVFHPGLHVSSNEESQMVKYRRQIDFLKPFGPTDIAILPIKGRHIEPAYEPYLYLLDQLAPKAIYLIGDDLATEEHRKCVEVLRARNIPVAYPEGGIAVGERFHYLRDRARKAQPPSAEARPGVTR